MPRSKNSDLLIVVGLTLLTVVVVTLNGPPLLRGLLTLPLVFALPGYALLAALFPAQELDTSARILMVLTLSLALAAVGGLVLHFTGLGLQSTTWLFLLAGIILAGSLVTFARRRTVAMPAIPGQSIQLKPLQLLLVAGALGLGVAALGIARSGVLSQPRVGFSQLWITPARSAPANVPGVKIGIANEEGTAARFRN